MAAVCLILHRSHGVQCDGCGAGWCLPDEVRTAGVDDWSDPAAFTRGRKALAEAPMIVWFSDLGLDLDLCLGCRARRN